MPGHVEVAHRGGFHLGEGVLAQVQVVAAGAAPLHIGGGWALVRHHHGHGLAIGRVGDQGAGPADGVIIKVGGGGGIELCGFGGAARQGGVRVVAGGKPEGRVVIPGDRAAEGLGRAAVGAVSLVSG